MRRLPLYATDSMIFEALKDFIGLLVEKKYSEAYDFLFHPPVYDWFSHSERIKSAIDDYLHDNHKMTPIDEAAGICREECEYGTAREDGNGEGTAWFALPVDGEWSDLMATFQIQIVEEALVLSLDDIHVP